eukprot:5451570-Pyramimonas_sp.AAC.1
MNVDSLGSTAPSAPGSAWGGWRRERSHARHAGAHVPTCGARTEHGRNSKIPAAFNSCGATLKSPSGDKGLPDASRALGDAQQEAHIVR